MVTAAGKFRRRLQFRQRALVSDGYGNVEGDFETVFTEQARVVPRFGSEAVLSSRLQGRQPYTVTVRASPQTRQVTTDWQAFDATANATYNIRSVAEDEGRREIDMLVETGTGEQ